ncbi:MAG TPA: hypothetical protein VKM72_30535 [Thermoanaerobaculia bacterium]|nr:hypothetical protein [Thermoanaerobaculia bacterium]
MQHNRWFLALGVAALAALPLGAQTLTAGPEITVHDAPFVPVYDPPIAASADGGFVAAWQDSARNYARSFSPADVPLGGARQVSSTETALLSPPRVATLASGRSVVVWSVSRLLNDLEMDLRIAARFLDAPGNPAGPEIELARADRIVRDPRSSAAVAVTAEPGGGFVAAWDLPGGIRARRFDAEGSPAGAEIVITGDGLFPSLAALPGGGFAVAWFHQTPSSPFGEVLLRLFRPDGLAATPEIRVADPLGHPDFNPNVSADDAGRLVVAWSESHFSETSPESTAWVRSRRFGPDGQPLAPALVVAETHVYRRGFLVGDVAARPDGSFLVSWLEADTLTGGPSDGSYINLNGEVWARAFTAAETPLGDAFRVATTPGGDQRAGEAAATPDGWIVSWTRAINGAGIFARRFSLSCGNGNEICLHDGRFRAEVVWHTSPSGPEGEGQPLGLTDDTGAFWFFSPTNVELVVKVLDGTPINGHFWVFYGSLTDVAFDLTVTDTLTGEERTYHNPAGTMASRADTEAFPQ